jgi:hypothetical protein
MVTTGGIAVGLNLNDIDKSKSLYTGMIPGISSTAQSYDIPIPFDTPQPSVDYLESEEQLKYYKNANDILYKQKIELRLEVKVYKKMIKKLLKKQ